MNNKRDLSQPAYDPSQPVPEVAAATVQRYIGMDVHKNFVTIAWATRDPDQPSQILARKVPTFQLAGWATKHLTRQDAVVFEASTNAWTLYDELAPLVHSVTVANPSQVWPIARATIKTDQHDAKSLAKLHAAGLIPAVWVPPAEVRARRSLMTHRRRLTRDRTQALNRLHAILHRYHLTPPAGKLDAEANREWWDQQPLSAVERLQVSHDLAQIAHLQAQLAEVEQLILQLTVDDPRAALLVQLPGIGPVIAMQLLAAIGDITRFPKAKKLVGYAGFGVRLHQTGQTVWTGKITKAGRRDLRWAMVEAARMAAQHHPHWQAEFQRLEPRLGENKARVAIARKLLVVVWHVLTHQVSDQHAQPEAVARKFYKLGSYLGRTGRRGRTLSAFTRAMLDQLALGGDMTVFQASRNRRVVLPPTALSTPPD